MSRMVTEAMVEALLSRFGMADFRKGSRAIGHDGPEKDRWEDYLEVPVDVLGRIEAALSVPAAEQKAEPVARKRFPILKGDGATIDWQLVEDHGGQAQQNHYQTVQRLAERGGLSWSELHAVLHNQRYRDMDANEAMLACRALEARYLAAIAPSTQADQKAEPVRKVQKMARFCAEIAWDTAFAWAIDHGRTDQEAYDAANSVRENVLVHALQDDALSTQAIEARNAVIAECIAQVHGEYTEAMLKDRDPDMGPPPNADFLRGWNVLRGKILRRLHALRAAEARQL